jgi:hypothetical protein
MTDLTTAEPDEAPPPATGRRRVRRSTLFASVALAIAGVVALIVVLNRGGDDKVPSTLVPPSPGQVLDASGAQLATLLTSARDHTFHARYTVRGDAKLLGGTLGLEWWNTKGHSRIDTTRAQSGKTIKTASFVNGTDGASCQKVDSGAWSCRRIEVPGLGDPNGMIATLTAELSGRPITERAGKVQGHDALCFHVSGGTEPIDVCTNADGVLLRNASAKVTYEADSLDSDVPDSIFTTPAKAR